MKFRTFEVTFAIPDDKKMDSIKIVELVEVLRCNNCDYGGDDCAIDVKEIKKNGKQEPEQ